MSKRSKSAEAKLKGDEAYNKGDYEAAENYYREALVSIPNGDNYSNRSATRSELYLFPQALADAEEAIRFNPTHWKSHAVKARALVGLKKIKEAAEEVEQAKRYIKEDELQEATTYIERIENLIQELQTGLDRSDVKVRLQETFQKASRMFEAAGKGDISRIQQFLDNGNDVGVSDSLGYTLLHHAAAMADPQMVNLLLKNGADPAKPNAKGGADNPLALAIMMNKNENLKTMLEWQKQKLSKEAFLQMLNQTGLQQLPVTVIYCMASDNVEALQMLMEYGQKTDTGILEKAAGEGAVKITKLLIHKFLKDGHRIDFAKLVEVTIGTNGAPSFELGGVKRFNPPSCPSGAHSCKHSELIEDFIKMGHCPNKLEFLMFAVSRGHLSIINTFLKHGVAPNAACFEKTAIYAHTEIAQVLISHLKSKPKGWEGHALHYAILIGSYGVAKALIEASCDLEAVHKDQGQVLVPIDSALNCGNPFIVKLLLDAGAKPDPKIKGRKPTMIHACRHETGAPIAQLLIERGVNVFVKDEHGNNPIALFAACGNLEVLQLLIAYVTAKRSQASAIEMVLELNTTKWNAVDLAAANTQIRTVKYLKGLLKKAGSKHILSKELEEKYQEAKKEDRKIRKKEQKLKNSTTTNITMKKEDNNDKLLSGNLYDTVGEHIFPRNFYRLSLPKKKEAMKQVLTYVQSPNNADAIQSLYVLVTLCEKQEGYEEMLYQIGAHELILKAYIEEYSRNKLKNKGNLAFLLELLVQFGMAQRYSVTSKLYTNEVMKIVTEIMMVVPCNELDYQLLKAAYRNCGLLYVHHNPRIFQLLDYTNNKAKFLRIVFTMMKSQHSEYVLWGTLTLQKVHYAQMDYTDFAISEGMLPILIGIVNNFDDSCKMEALHTLHFFIMHKVEEVIKVGGISASLKAMSSSHQSVEEQAVFCLSHIAAFAGGSVCEQIAKLGGAQEGARLLKHGKTQECKTQAAKLLLVLMATDSIREKFWKDTVKYKMVETAFQAVDEHVKAAEQNISALNNERILFMEDAIPLMGECCKHEEGIRTLYNLQLSKLVRRILRLQGSYTQFQTKAYNMMDTFYKNADKLRGVTLDLSLLDQLRDLLQQRFSQMQISGDIALKSDIARLQVLAETTVSGQPFVGYTCCDGCGKSKDVDTENFKRCSRCKKAHYCSKECQVKAWKTHKLVCTETK